MTGPMNPGFGCVSGAAIARALSGSRSVALEPLVLDPALRADRIAKISEWFDNLPSHKVFFPFGGVEDRMTDEKLRAMPVGEILEAVVTGVFEHLQQKIGRTVGDLMDFFGLNGGQLRDVAFTDADGCTIDNYMASIAWDSVLEHGRYAPPPGQFAFCASVMGPPPLFAVSSPLHVDHSELDRMLTELHFRG